MLVRGMLLLSYLGPLSYAGATLGIAVHEFVGHGITAWALGGEFSGMALHPNVSGVAYVSPAPDAPRWHLLAILAGGVISTIVPAAIMLATAARLRGFPFVRIGLAVLAACFGLDAALYTFWNACVPNPPGDVGRIIQITQSSSLRWILILVSAVLVACFLLAPMAIVIRESNRWLRVSAESSLWSRAAMPVLIGMAFGIGQFAHDWKAIDGIGSLAKNWGIMFALAATIVLLRVPCDSRPLPSPPLSILLPIVVGWLLLSGLVLAMALGLNQGIRW